MINLKQRLNKRQVTIGAWITLSDLSTAEIMAKSGFDWLVVDMEHSAITLHQAQQLIQIIGLCGIVPLVRVSENNPVIIKRAMDAGAQGIIVPMVNSRDDAERAVQAVRYPPAGIRGVGLARAQGYGLEFEKYKNRVNSDSIVIVQIEHISAVENLEEILDIEGVDGFIVGPYDLSASLGRPGEFNHPTVKKALARVKVIAKSKNALMGYHVIPPQGEEVAKKIREGYRFLGFSLDTLFLGVKCRSELTKARRRK
jgi:2-dehydro-3-deoxyglucarate aldolase